MKKSNMILVTSTIILLLAFLTIIQIQPISKPLDSKTEIVLNNDFSVAETTYSNMTMHFSPADPYDGYTNWSYTYLNGVMGPSTNEFYMGTEYVNNAQFFGFDEFVNHSICYATVKFRTHFTAGTYNFIPLGYFYQKTSLESKTHWAMALLWVESGLCFYQNTANGNTPTYTNLTATAPAFANNYQITLNNFGLYTSITVYDLVAGSMYYNGNISTPTYDARSLYPGIGEYSTSNGSISGVWDNLCIIDTSLTEPDNGFGFSLIDGYIDEAYTHTFYDSDTGLNSTLSVDSTVTNITLVIQCWVNGTRYFVSSVSDAKNIIRHNVTVTNTNGTTMFSQSNFTYLWGIEYEDNVFVFEYMVELDFSVVMGDLYTTHLTMEVFSRWLM